MSVVTGALGLDAIGAAINGGTAGANPVTGEELGIALADISYRFSVVAAILTDADRAASESVTAATDAATQIEEVGSDVKNITEHTYNTVIPHSLSWLAGYVVVTWIDPIRARLDKDESDIRFLMGWRSQIDTWRQKFVDPNVEKWVGFKQWFDGWPQGVLFKWHDWFEHPDNFASWATPPLVGPIVAYLAARGHEQTRDNLSDILASAWQDDAERIWQYVQHWLLSDT